MLCYQKAQSLTWYKFQELQSLLPVVAQLHRLPLQHSILYLHNLLEQQIQQNLLLIRLKILHRLVRYSLVFQVYLQ